MNNNQWKFGKEINRSKKSGYDGFNIIAYHWISIEHLKESVLEKHLIQKFYKSD